MSRLRVVIFSEQEAYGAELHEQLAAGGRLRVALPVSDPERLADTVRKERTDALVVDLGSDPQYVLERVAALPAPRPALLFVGRTDESDVILAAMRLGAKEFFPRPPEAGALRGALDRVLAEATAAVPAPRRAPAIAVMGAKGGVGATVVACQLATSLQRLGGRVAVMDLNLPLGDVALHFDLQPEYTLASVASESERLDATALRTILRVHHTGVSVLAAPRLVEEAELVRGPLVEQALSLLREEFDWVVLDVSRSWNEASVRALDIADRVLLVTLMDVPTLNHARAHLDLLRRLGHPDGKLRLLANRYSRSDAVTDQDFASFLGRPPDACIPNDFRTTVESVNQGRPIGEVAPRAPLSRAYAGLAEQLCDWCGIERPEPEPRGLAKRIGRLLGRRDHGTD